MERIKPRQYKTYINSNGNKAYRYLFYCPYCEQDVWRHDYRGRYSKSCNCVRLQLMSISAKSRKKYDDYKSTLNNYWSQIKSQCYQKNNKSFKFHGGRCGREICNEWLDYRIFKKWAIKNGYIKGMCLHLIDIYGDYSPSNCVWKRKRAKIKHRFTQASHNIPCN